jgi:hypothetical protein
VKPGKHIGKVIKVTFGHSSQKGTPHFAVEFQVESDTGLEVVTGNIWLTEAAMGIARKSIKAIGFDPDVEELQILVDNPMKLTGNDAMLTVVEEERKDGEYEMRVAFIDPIPGPPKPGELASFTKAIRAVKGSGKKGAAAKAKAETSTKEIEKHFTGAGGSQMPSTTEPGDDIPF